MKNIIFIILFLLLTNLALAETKSCKEQKYKEYVKEVSYRSSPTICKDNTLLLEFLLKPGFDKGDKYFNGIVVSIGSHNTEVITIYSLNLHSSKYRPSAHTCINDKYLAYSTVEFYFRNKTSISTEKNGNKLVKFKSRGSSEKCPINTVIKNTYPKPASANSFLKNKPLPKESYKQHKCVNNSTRHRLKLTNEEICKYRKNGCLSVNNKIPLVMYCTETLQSDCWTKPLSRQR